MEGEGEERDAAGGCGTGSQQAYRHQRWRKRGGEAEYGGGNMAGGGGERVREEGSADEMGAGEGNGGNGVVRKIPVDRKRPVARCGAVRRAAGYRTEPRTDNSLESDAGRTEESEENN